MVPPINVITPIISLKRNHANNEAIMGSPIGVDATMVGDTWRMEWYIKPCPNNVGIIPSIKSPMKSIIEYPNKDDCIKNEIMNKVKAAVEKSARE